MKEKAKNLIITASFIFILCVVFLLNIFVKDNEISISERRKLEQFPEITFQGIFSGKTMEEFEKYVSDQFISRDFFRSIKTAFSTKVLMQKDNNGLFEKNGAIYKIEYPLNEKNVQKTADKMNLIFDKYLKDINNNTDVYYAIIPDKNYYLEENDYLKMDYLKLQEIMQEKLINFKYIDIWNELALEDYYKTDSHWKQENLRKVVSKIQEEMDLKNTSEVIYKVENKGDFYGAYYGQFGISVLPDNINILINDTIENCTTYNYETKESGKVYTENNLQDKYDIFLYGATPLVYIENPSSKYEKELLLFRDSYGSSIAPLLIENYKKITLIDLRYISNELLEQYISFNNQDVLFLYSTLLINQNVLK